MHLAGVTLPDYSQEALDRFTLQKDTTYRADWDKIDEFEYQYFHGKKIGPNGMDYYNT